jgi:hypothetical protein
MPNKTVIAVNVNSVNKGRAASHSINIINLSLFTVALALRGIQFPFADLASSYTGRSTLYELFSKTFALVHYHTAINASCQD